MRRSIHLTLCMICTCLWPQGGFAAAAGAFNDLDTYNVVWYTPSEDATGSMPLGNGDISLNVWVETTGDLLFYIGKTDAWGDNARLLKVGKVRVSLKPNILANAASFRQTLGLRTAEVLIEAEPNPSAGNGSTKIRVWVDANHPVIHVMAESTERIELTARIEPWRTQRQELASIEISDIYCDPTQANRQHAPTIVEPDTILTGRSSDIGWYHHNVKSVGPELTMRLQGLSGYPLADPLLGRTFGAVVAAERGRRVDDVTLISPDSASHRLSVTVLTQHPASPAQWLERMDQLIARVNEIDFLTRRRAHETWWRDFWDRSWIFVRDTGETSDREMIGRNTHPVRIGTDQADGSRFAGEIGRVSLLRTALGEAMIAQLSRSQRTALAASDLLGSWVDVPSGEIVDDLRPEQMTGSLTVEAWVKPETMPESGGRIVDKITPGANDGILLDTWPGNSLRLITAAGVLAQKDCLTPGRWHHVAATIEKATGRQKLFLDGRKIAELQVSAEDAGLCLTRGYCLQRFINACAGRGRYPIKFNGSLFTVPFEGAPGDADYRRWGPGYWWQNTRLPYISMCASGDFDLMEPLFRMYIDELLPLCTYRTKQSLGHDGAFMPECIMFWGAIFNETYGWTPFEQRDDKLQASGYHKWEWVSGPELVFMMLDYYDYTQDAEFLRTRVLPAADEILTFFDQHYETDADGTLVMHPSQALETWWDCTNPMPEVAGLHAVTDRLLALDEALTGPQRRQFLQALKVKLPQLPTREVDGVRMLAPAERFDMKRNIENPELYAVFPFRLIAVGKPQIDLGIEALNHRWDKGHSGWRQDDIFMAYLGLADQARTNITARARSHDENSRFPAFWGPNYDWVPDQDHGGVLLKALQSMLMQTDGETIYLLPAWPQRWDADFKLHGPRRTVLKGRIRGGRLERLDVSPSTRHKDIAVMGSPR